MSLTPEEIADREFLVGLRGYDQAEVRSFLRTVAEAFGQARTDGDAAAPAPPPPGAAAPVTDTQWADVGGQIAAVLRTAHEQAATLRSDAAKEVQALREQAEADATETRSQADAHAETARAEAEQAQAEAKDKLSTAQDEALSLVADAQARVAKMLESSKVRAQQEADASVAHLTSQIGELRSARDASKVQLAELRTRLDDAITAADALPPAPPAEDTPETF